MKLGEANNWNLNSTNLDEVALYISGLKTSRNRLKLGTRCRGTLTGFA